MPVTDQAFVTLSTNDVYCQGALVLGKSLRNHETSRQLVVMITPQVSSHMRTSLGKVFDEVLEVDLLDSADSVRLLLLKRPELGVTFTKIQCWTLTQYTKCVYMDADTIALRNIDELFDREELSAAPDSGWPDCFNSGVFVFRPSLDTFKYILQYARDHGSFDGGDQGLLNSFFSNWATADISKHLPFIYNLSISSVYTYIPAFKQFGSEAKVVHFIGTPKPWNCKYNPQTKCIVEEESLSGNQHLLFLVHWWEIYTTDILPLLTEQEGLDCTNKHQFGRIELQMKCDNVSSDCAKEDHSDSPSNTILKSCIQETLTVASECYETITAPADLANDDGLDVQPSSSSEQRTLDDHLHGEDLLPSQLSPQPVTEEDSVHMPHVSKSVSELAIQEAEEVLKAEEERRKWEEGHIDYMGRHSFDNIQKKLDRFLQ